MFLLFFELLYVDAEAVAKPVEGVAIGKYENVPPHVAVRVQLHPLVPFEPALRKLSHVERKPDTQVQE